MKARQPKRHQNTEMDGKCHRSVVWGEVLTASSGALEEDEEMAACSSSSRLRRVRRLSRVRLRILVSTREDKSVARSDLTILDLSSSVSSAKPIPYRICRPMSHKLRRDRHIAMKLPDPPSRVKEPSGTLSLFMIVDDWEKLSFVKICQPTKRKKEKRKWVGKHIAFGLCAVANSGWPESISEGVYLKV